MVGTVARILGIGLMLAMTAMTALRADAPAVRVGIPAEFGVVGSTSDGAIERMPAGARRP